MNDETRKALESVRQRIAAAAFMADEYEKVGDAIRIPGALLRSWATDISEAATEPPPRGGK